MPPLSGARAIPGDRLTSSNANLLLLSSISTIPRRGSVAASDVINRIEQLVQDMVTGLTNDSASLSFSYPTPASSANPGGQRDGARRLRLPATREPDVRRFGTPSNTHCLAQS